MAKMNWTKVARETLERRRGVAYAGQDDGVVARHNQAEQVRISRLVDKHPFGENPRSQLMAKLHALKDVTREDFANWSESELKTARDICNTAALGFNDQLKRMKYPRNVHRNKPKGHS